MARKVQKKLDKWKSKSWYNIETPEFIGRNNIGTTLAEEPAQLIGRIVEATVGDLTNDFSKHTLSSSSGSTMSMGMLLKPASSDTK